MRQTVTGTTYEQGDVVLIKVPFSDMTGVKKRPALVISNASFNGGSQDIIVCGITSNLTNTPHSVPIENKDMLTGKMPKPSLIKANHVFTLSKGVILDRWGRARPEIVQQTKAVLGRLL